MGVECLHVECLYVERVHVERVCRRSVYVEHVCTTRVGVYVQCTVCRSVCGVCVGVDVKQQNLLFYIQAKAKVISDL